MKFIRIFFISFCCCLSFAQKQAGVVSYRLELNNDYRAHLEREAKKSSQLRLIKEIIEDVSNGMRFKLTFCNNESFFEKEELLLVEKGNLQMYDAVAKSFNSGKYYTNLDTEEILMIRDIFGKKYFVKMPWSKWTISSENNREKILNYNCFIAETKQLDSDGKSERKITAWFAPEINIPFGPNEYSKLPGLILKVQLPRYSLIVEKIYFGECDLEKFKVPKNTVDYKDFLDEANEINRKLRK